MNRNPNMMQECFNRLCRFHLNTGVTLVGGVIDDANGMITLKPNRDSDKTITFSQSLVHDYKVYDAKGWDMQQIRGDFVSQHSQPYVNNVKTRKLIIFGAGASSDFKSGEYKGLKPPITNNLFKENNLLKGFSGAYKLRPKVLTFIEAGGTLEEFFEEKWQEVVRTGNNELLCQLINTQFYLQFFFREVSFNLLDDYPNNYCTLIEHMRRYILTKNTKENKEGKIIPENIAVVSFNYDTLFENALFHIYDFKYSSTHDYVFSKKGNDNYLRDIMLFKPHGSWNWIHPLEQGLLKKGSNTVLSSIKDVANAFLEKGVNYAQLKLAIAPNLIDTDMSLEEIPRFLLDRFEVVDYNHSFNYEFYPNLLIPFKSKDETLMPLLHNNMMGQSMSDVDEILIIGWKGTEENFNLILKSKFSDKPIKITYVSPNTTTTEDELKKYLPNASFERFKGGFSDYLREIKYKPDAEFNFFK